MIISNKQLSAFAKDALETNVKAMLRHVEVFFPYHFLVMDELSLSGVIQQAFRKARQYGFQSVRNSCLFLNNMLLLGSNFDTDPQYPWVKEFLVREEWGDPNEKIDDLSDEVLHSINSIA